MIPTTAIRRDRCLYPAATTSIDHGILSLPDDLLIECFRHLPVTHFPSLALGCSRFAHVLLHHPRYASLRCHQQPQCRVDRDHKKLLLLSVSSDFSVLMTTNMHITSPSPHFCSSAFPIPPNLYAATDTSHATTITIGNSLYLIGPGLNLRLDILTGVIIPCAKLHFLNANFAAATVGGKIYVAGGVFYSRTIMEYDPCSDKWQPASSSKSPDCLSRSSMCVALNGKLYFLVDAEFPSIIPVYNPSTGIWSQITLSLSPCDMFLYRPFLQYRSRAVSACAGRNCIHLLMQNKEHLVLIKLIPDDADQYFFSRFCYLPETLTKHREYNDEVRFSCATIGHDVLAVLIIEASQGSTKKGGTLVMLDLHAHKWIDRVPLPAMVSPLERVAFTGIGWA